MVYDVTFHPSWWYRNAGISFTKSFFEDPACRVAADMKMRRRLFEKFGEWGIGSEHPEPRPILGSDLIASGYLLSELLGCSISYSEATPPAVLCLGLSEDEALHFRAPDLAASKVWEKTEEQIFWLQKEYGSVHAAVNLQGVLNLALDLRGESIFVDMYQYEAAARNLLRQCLLLSLNVGRRLKEVSSSLSGGVTAITNCLAIPSLYVHSNCSVEMVSLDTYREFLLEHDIALSHAFQPYGVHHCGGSMEHVAAGYAEIPNLSFAEIGAGSDISEVRRQLPNCHLNLRYSPVKLAVATEDELREDLYQMVNTVGGNTEAVSVSCVGIDASVPDGQISLFLSILKEL